MMIFLSHQLKRLSICNVEEILMIYCAIYKFKPCTYLFCNFYHVYGEIYFSLYIISNNVLLTKSIQ